MHVKNDEPLRYATKSGHFEVVKYLVNQGADVRAIDDHALRLAAENGQLGIVKYLVELEDGAHVSVYASDGLALRWAAHNGKLSVVKYLVDQGVDLWLKMQHYE